jgi:hypothetical protein
VGRHGKTLSAIFAEPVRAAIGRSLNALVVDALVKEIKHAVAPQLRVRNRADRERNETQLAMFIVFPVTGCIDSRLSGMRREYL